MLLVWESSMLSQMLLFGGCFTRASAHMRQQLWAFEEDKPKWVLCCFHSDLSDFDSPFSHTRSLTTHGHNEWVRGHTELARTQVHLDYQVKWRHIWVWDGELQQVRVRPSGETHRQRRSDWAAGEQWVMEPSSICCIWTKAVTVMGLRQQLKAASVWLQWLSFNSLC